MARKDMDICNSDFGPEKNTNSSGKMMNNCAGRFVDKLFRKKRIDFGNLCDTKLSRCLNLFDLTALGIGSTLGAGIYVVAGQVAKTVAGPAVIFSFLIAAIASVFAGLCYAEFGSRVPKTGSAYVYSYVTVGEIWAFIIGWTLILEYMIGAASVARAWSATLDGLAYNRISEAMIKLVPLNIPQLSEYPDFLALGITIFSTMILIIGVKSSSRFNNIFTMLNILVVLFVIVTGVIRGNISYWKIDTKLLDSLNTTGTIADNQNLGVGGFFPFGFSGVLTGAATCFYAFIGFDAIATTGEEVINPQRTIPISIILSLLCCFLAYVGISASLTLMIPYFELDSNAPIPFAFAYIGWNKVKILVSIGSMCGLSTSLMGSMFPLPRVIYAMASDGLIFRRFAKVSPKLKTPILATICAGSFAGIMAMIFNLKELVDMMSLGTLLAYTLVAACVLLLRYRPNESSIGVLSTPSPLMPLDEFILSKENSEKLDFSSSQDDNIDDLQSGAGRTLWKRLFFPRGRASISSSKIVTFFTTLACLSITIFCIIMSKAEKHVFDSQPVAIIPLAILGVIILMSFYIIFMQPQNQMKLNFKVPLVPLLPFLSIFINLYLMMKLGVNTWIRFAVWMTAGLLIYFLYGIRHSSERDMTSMLLFDDSIKRRDYPSSDTNNNGNSGSRKEKIKMLAHLKRLNTEHDNDGVYELETGTLDTIKVPPKQVGRVETQLTLVPSELDIKNL
ncbi:unnamed protein product [Gordionus sp. m RMFG-2023]|uniref:high affinity cationic amino acid transporter 1-like n=1 Tax=Gordionus sp. m RMFG-2023 TaxID=3053472 RepID=UPI0030E26E15